MNKPYLTEAQGIGPRTATGVRILGVWKKQEQKELLKTSGHSCKAYCVPARFTLFRSISFFYCSSLFLCQVCILTILVNAVFLIPLIGLFGIYLEWSRQQYRSILQAWYLQWCLFKAFHSVLKRSLPFLGVL